MRVVVEGHVSVAFRAFVVELLREDAHRWLGDVVFGLFFVDDWYFGNDVHVVYDPCVWDDKPRYLAVVGVDVDPMHFVVFDPMVRPDFACGEGSICEDVPYRLSKDACVSARVLRGEFAHRPHFQAVVVLVSGASVQLLPNVGESLAGDVSCRSVGAL